MPATQSTLEILIELPEAEDVEALDLGVLA